MKTPLRSNFRSLVRLLIRAPERKTYMPIAILALALALPAYAATKTALKPFKTLCDLEDEASLAWAIARLPAGVSPGSLTPPKATGLALGQLKPRKPHQKPKSLRFDPNIHSGALIVKFVEGSNVSVANGQFVSSNKEVNLTPINDLIAKSGISFTIEPVFTRPADELRAEKLCGERRSGEELADLTTYFAIFQSGERNIDLAQMSVDIVFSRLIESELIETLQLGSRPTPAPRSDIAPATLSCIAKQTYSLPATANPPGIDAQYAWTIPGGKGQNVKFVDVENGWATTHEDLNDPTLIDVRAPLSAFGSAFAASATDHGTSVLGVVIGDGTNGIGIEGIASAAQYGIHSVLGRPSYEDGIANAINTGSAALTKGDVLLIEAQISGAAPSNQGGSFSYLFPEDSDIVFNAVESAIKSRGIVVVETAGNGAVFLGHPDLNGKHLPGHPNFRDSGAIVVGSRRLDGFSRNDSTFGERVDTSAWGEAVFTISDTVGVIGTSCDPTATLLTNQRYTNDFAGTSSAGAIIAGAAASLQVIQKARGGAPMSSTNIRALFRLFGTAQSTPDFRQIGKMPDLRAIYTWMIGDNEGDGVTNIDELVSGRNPDVDERKLLLVILIDD
jgi:serine protease